VLGAALALLPLPETLHQAGPLFLVAAVVLALFRKAPSAKESSKEKPAEEKPAEKEAQEDEA
jgi:hypothetical protein